MKVLHGSWIPDTRSGFIQSGAFYLWVETPGPEKKSKPSKQDSSRCLHPQHLSKDELAIFLDESLGLPNARDYDLSKDICPRYFWLPSLDSAPVPSLEMSRYLEQEGPQADDPVEWQQWEVSCYRMSRLFRGNQHFPGISAMIPLLKELHFIAQYQLAEVQVGADLLFWLHYTQAFKQVALKDHYIPSLRYRKGEKNIETYPHWEIVSEPYEETLQRYVGYMPLVCTAGFADSVFPEADDPSDEDPDEASGTQSNKASSKKIGKASSKHSGKKAVEKSGKKASKKSEKKSGQKSEKAPEQITGHFYDRETLLRHCSECLLHDIVTRTPLPQMFYKQVEGSLLYSCLKSSHWTTNTPLTLYEQWWPWRDHIARTQTHVPFYLCFQLRSPDQETGTWELSFKVSPKEQPSLRVELAEYWRLDPDEQAELKQKLGENFEQALLFALGDAARMYLPLWAGLETDEPAGIELDIDAAFDFLNEAAWVLEDAGCKVIVPAWWTPQGRKRARLKLKASSKTSGEEKANSYFSFGYAGVISV